MYQYPYGNAQQLNLDWILSKLQELESGSGGGADLEEVANALVSASFDATIPYRKYDYAFYDGKLYRALNDTIGAFNPADWLEVTLGADIPVLTRLLNAVDASLTTLQGQVADLDSDDVDNASNVTGTTVTAALDNLNGAINDLTNYTHNVSTTKIATNNTTNVASGQITSTQSGNLIAINGEIKTVSDGVGAWLQTLCTLDADTRPSAGRTVWAYATYDGTPQFVGLELLTDGTLRTRITSSAGHQLTGNTWVTIPNQFVFA